MRKEPVLTSVALHVGAIALLLLIAQIPSVQNAMKRLPDRMVPLVAPRLPAGGGRGQRNPLPASRGQVPPRAIAKVFVPPMAVRMENPKLIVQQAMIEVPAINISAPDIGDPLGRVGAISGGPGGPFGIGDGTGPGIGPGKNPGQGGIGPPTYHSLGITQEPKLLHSEEPEYSEEARKARYQGTVILAVEVDVSGGVKNIRVVRGLGLGLDEKAIAAVLKWRFRPAMAGGRPVTAPAQIQVTFHLL